MPRTTVTPFYSPEVLKRIQRDLTTLKKEPVINAAAQPKTDDLTYWDAVIRIPITHNIHNHVDMHFSIIFPSNYPQSPPNIGFSFDFPYNLGASYKEQHGPLKGKIVICLDILGNMANVHTEWKSSVGSGWSPSYTVSSLLINLQSILNDLDASLLQEDRNTLVDKSLTFFKENPALILEIPTKENKNLMNIKEHISKRGLELAKKLGILESVDKLKQLLDSEQELVKEMECTLKENKKDLKAEKIDPNIVCYVTGANYTEDILGYGLACVKQGRQVNFSTPAELISKGAYDSGIRQSSNKQPFKYFLPAFINKKHAGQEKWKIILRETLIEIGYEEYDSSSSLLSKTAYDIFSRLINTLVVEMMKQPDMSQSSYPLDEDYDSDEDFDVFLNKNKKRKIDQERLQKSPSIAYFEALCSFWRTFYWLSESSMLPIQKQGTRVVYDFTKSESKRLKETCPDVGSILAAFSVFQSSSKITSFEEFIDSYLDECFVRCIKWWKNAPVESRPRVDSRDVDAFFVATKVSRDITLFQLMFLHYVIGRDEKSTVELLDKTNGKAPQILEKFQKEWKAAQGNVNDWNSFFSFTGCGKDLKKEVNNDVKYWIEKCIRKAYKRGKAYI